MGGCPSGPADVGTPKPGTASVVRSTDKESLSVTWKGTEAVPGAGAITGYSVEAVQQTASATGERVVLGKRAVPAATHATIAGLNAREGYEVEVRAISGPKMSEAYTVQVPTPEPDGDQVRPELTATPGDTAAVNVTSEIKLTSEPGADIYYTLDGSPAIEGDLPSDKALHYTEPIAISQEVTLNAVVFDRAGNFSLFSAAYKPPVDTTPAPSAITTLTGTAGQASVTLNWSTAEAGITGYGVQAYVNGEKAGELKEITAKTLTINSLNAGTQYYFSVKAKNKTGYGPESDRVGPLVPIALTDKVTIASATWKNGDFRISGSGSVAGAILTVRPATSSGAIDRSRSLGIVQSVPAVAPATGGTWDLRLRNANAPATNPGRVFVESQNGGVAGPFVVTNK